jgi:hypothetical protein
MKLKTKALMEMRQIRQRRKSRQGQPTWCVEYLKSGDYTLANFYKHYAQVDTGDTYNLLSALKQAATNRPCIAA